MATQVDYYDLSDNANPRKALETRIEAKLTDEAIADGWRTVAAYPVPGQPVGGHVICVIYQK